MILVTGAAGFIGAHVLGRLSASGRAAAGIDNFNDYYEVGLKHGRVEALVTPHGAQVHAVDCADAAALQAFFAAHPITQVIHLAAQAGVRYSLVNPGAYVASNLVGFTNVLECCRNAKVGHLVYASSSSVYGNNSRVPWDENANIAHPVSLYAATKAANEQLAHSYSHLYRIPATGLRFFTAYGPWGRPDMAPMLFAKAILAGVPIKVFNHGKMERDFTYIDDIAQAVCAVVDKPATPDPAYDRSAPAAATSDAPHRIFNVGNNQPVLLLDFIAKLETKFGRKAVRQLEPMQPGDIRVTCAATRRLEQWIGFTPATSLDDGLARFSQWYRAYH
jgi:UDP-glucuronate 4-epimerase